MNKPQPKVSSLTNYIGVQTWEVIWTFWIQHFNNGFSCGAPRVTWDSFEQSSKKSTHQALTHDRFTVAPEFDTLARLGGWGGNAQVCGCGSKPMEPF